MKRVTVSHPPVIDKAKNLPLLVRIRDVILTILVWLLYLYFMRDFFVITSDAISWTFHGFSSEDSEYSLKIVATIISYLEIIFVMELVFVAWSLYNMLRFGKKRRRRARPVVTVEETAKMFHSSVEDVEVWQHAQTLTMHHDKAGRLTKVVTS